MRKIYSKLQRLFCKALVSKSFFADKKRVFYEVISAKKELPTDNKLYLTFYSPEGLGLNDEVKWKKKEQIAWLARPENMYSVCWLKLVEAKNVC